MSLTQLKKRWNDFKKLEPGTRFQTQYDRHQRSAAGKSPLKRAAYLIIAVLCLAIGVVLVFIPGPAVVFFAIAAGLLAVQSQVVARACDRCELRARETVAKLKRWKRQASAKHAGPEKNYDAGSGAALQGDRATH